LIFSSQKSVHSGTAALLVELLVMLLDDELDEVLAELDEPELVSVDEAVTVAELEQTVGRFGQVVTVSVTTTVTTLWGLVRIEPSEPCAWSALAATPETRAEMARSDWSESERRRILTLMLRVV